MRRVLASLLPILLFLLTIGIAFFVALREDSLFAMNNQVAESVEATLAAAATEPVNIAATLVAEAAPDPTATPDGEAMDGEEMEAEPTATVAADDGESMSDSETEETSDEESDTNTGAEAMEEDVASDDDSMSADENDTDGAENVDATATEVAEDNADEDADTVVDAATPTMAGPTPEPCRPRSDWHPYMVEIGENLFRIGLRYNLTVAQMQRANCLPTTRIDAGQIIFVPEKELPPTVTPMPAAANDDWPLLGFGAASYSITENDGTLTIFLQTSAPISEAVSFEIGAVEGSAVNGQDFNLSAQTVTIAAGQSDFSLSIPILDDEAYEGDEVFFLYVTDATNAVVPEAEASITVTITENDAKPADVEPTLAPTDVPDSGEPTATPEADTADVTPAPVPTLGPDGIATIGFGAASYEVNESEGSILIPLQLSHPTDTDVISLVTISNISTVYGEDMRFEIGNYIIPIGQTTIYLQVMIMDDDIAEETEQFTIYLFEPSNASLSPTTGSAVISIVDNDG